MKPIIINNDIEKITEYYNNLPQVFLNSESVIKVKATSLALREYNLRYRVVGFKTKSGVNEQPLSVEETHAGAEGRLSDLKTIVNGEKPKLWVSIESGNAKIHPKYNLYNLTVCVIENEEGKRVATIDTEMEIPKSMTDLVPSKYPDLGVLVQTEFGIKNKDPFIHMTGGKLSRDKLVYNSIVNTLACL